MVGQPRHRVRERRGRSPRLREHHVQRASERLGDVNVPKRRRVGDDGVRDERRRSHELGVGRRDRGPEGVHHLAHHVDLLEAEVLHLADDGAYARQRPRRTGERGRQREGMGEDERG